MSEQQEFRHELEATLAAREEMGKELEPQLVDRFADASSRRSNGVRSRTKRVVPRSGHNAAMIPLALGSLGLAIPLIAGGRRQGRFRRRARRVYRDRAREFLLGARPQLAVLRSWQPRSAAT
jgi:hypothetical protein